MRAATPLAAAAVAVALGALLAWRGPGPAGSGPGGSPARDAAAAPDRAAREADDVIDAARRGRFSSALAGAFAFLGRFSPGDLDEERRAAFGEARLDAGRWGVSRSLDLAEGGELDAAEALLARARRVLGGTEGEAEAEDAARRIALLIERAQGLAAAKDRDEALVPVEAALAASRARAAKDPEGALAGILDALNVAVHPEARRRLEAEVAVLGRAVRARKGRADLRRRADAAIQRGDYRKAREILEGLVGDAASPDPEEAAKDRERLEGLKDLEENREPEALAACRKALRWLVAQQIDDGSFSVPVTGDDGKKRTDEERRKAPNRAGLTGLAALALLGHVRYDITDEFAPNLDRALAWLLAAQKPDGSFGRSSYENSIGALVLVDADRLLRRHEVKPSAEKALRWVLEAQNSDGGWRYQPRLPPSDMSVTGWAFQSLLHARLGDYEIPPNAVDLAQSYVDRMTDPVTGRAGYMNPGQGSYAMTAAALFCRLRNGQGPEDPRVALAADWLGKRLPSEKWGESAYSLFYASDAMSRLGGNHWRRWSPALKKYLLATQVKEGDAAGAWPSAGDAWGKRPDVGPVFVVSLHAIALENFFEHRE
jgi:hypothetical protein